MLRMEGRAAHGALAHGALAHGGLVCGACRELAAAFAARSPCGRALGERVFGPPAAGGPPVLRGGALGAESSAGPRGIIFFSSLPPEPLDLSRGSPTMLALAVFIAAGAPNAWALLVPARRVTTRGGNRILSEASFEQFKLVAADAAEDDDFGGTVAIDGDTVVVGAYFDDDGSEPRTCLRNMLGAGVCARRRGMRPPILVQLFALPLVTALRCD